MHRRHVDELLTACAAACAADKNCFGFELKNGASCALVNDKFEPHIDDTLVQEKGTTFSMKICVPGCR